MNPRFLHPAVRESGQVIVLDGEDFHHLRSVLRLRAGDLVGLFDGMGKGFAGRILEVGPRTARIRVEEPEDPLRESALNLSLWVALMKGEKLDLVIQKTTELGIVSIQPVTTARSELRVVPGRESRKLERWRRVAREACKQSGRCRVPLVEPPADLTSVLSHPPEGLRLVLDPEVDTEPSLSRRIPVATLVTLAVGPEGGWSDEERDGFRRADFFPLRLGPRILRAETAAIVSTALVQYLAGDMTCSPSHPADPDGITLS